MNPGAPLGATETRRRQAASREFIFRPKPRRKRRGYTRPLSAASRLRGMIFCPDPRHKCRGNSRVRDDRVLQTFGSYGAKKVFGDTDRAAHADGSGVMRTGASASPTLPVLTADAGHCALLSGGGGDHFFGGVVHTVGRDDADAGFA